MDDILNDKSKIYCHKCYKEGKRTLLEELDEEDNTLFKSPECGHYNRYFSTLRWCENCEDFKSFRGLKVYAQCYSCVMSKNSLKAIEKGVHSCQNPETSLANKELHARTIKSQLERGTFCMFNPEIHRKATENRVKTFFEREGECPKCGAITKNRTIFGICSDCQGKITRRLMNEGALNKGVQLDYCEECSYETNHIGSRCLNCNPLPIASGLYYKHFLKRPCSNCKCECLFIAGSCSICEWDKIQSLQKKFCNNCNSETSHIESNCLNCSNIELISSRMVKLNDEIYFSSYNGSIESWNNFKANFEGIKLDENKLKLDLYQQINIFEGFDLIPTFKKRYTKTWGEAKELFEYSLLEMNYKWFVYIKMYIDNNGNYIPLVCGKTGSRNVNKRGTDVCFSYKDKHGPSRRFLNHENLEWCETHILTKCFETEEEALKYEKEIQLKYNLLGS